MKERQDSNRDLPEPLQAEWNHDQVRQLFSDLAAGAQVSHVQVRTVSGQQPADRETTLSQASDLFNAGEARAIQIRYEYDGQRWYDTLMVGGPTVRIVRTLAIESP